MHRLLSYSRARMSSCLVFSLTILILVGGCIAVQECSCSCCDPAPGSTSSACEPLLVKVTKCSSCTVAQCLLEFEQCREYPSSLYVLCLSTPNPWSQGIVWLTLVAVITLLGASVAQYKFPKLKLLIRFGQVTYTHGAVPPELTEACERMRARAHATLVSPNLAATTSPSFDPNSPQRSY